MNTHAGSLMSLGSGLLFGSLVVYGAYRTSVNPKDFVFLFGTFMHSWMVHYVTWNRFTIHEK